MVTGGRRAGKSDGKRKDKADERTTVERTGTEKSNNMQDTKKLHNKLSCNCFHADGQVQKPDFGLRASTGARGEQN